MEEMKFRLARLSDFDEVVNLSRGIYDGHDYLPLEFHRWMKTENFAVMVAVVGEKLVGLRAGFIVDDGKTCIRRAGRVLPEFRGRGVSKKLSQVLDEYVRHNFPSVIRVRFVTTYNVNSKSCLTILARKRLLQRKRAKKFQLSRLLRAPKNIFLMLYFLTLQDKSYFQTVFFSTIVSPSSCVVQILNTCYKNLTISNFTPRNVPPTPSRSHSALGVLPLELTTFTGQHTFTRTTYVSTKLIFYISSSVLAKLLKAVLSSFRQLKA